MSDNIRNFNDYRKKITNDEHVTEEINIEIQDPLDFLSADEREEYYRTQHEAMDRERDSIEEDSSEFYLDEDEKAAEEKSKAFRKKTRVVADEDWEDEETGGKGIDPLIIVRISSIITGIIILTLIGMIFKAKVYDRYLVPDPDEAKTKVEVLELAGYTRTDDKIVTTADLNLRNTPSTASDEFIVTKVPKGTVIDRVAVSDDGEWAQINYEGQLLFCSMKYAAVQE
ncbi:MULTISPECIES: SH3 domain-containing protein [unclassified Butyrivibrio]|uniref:SH3 domain-containing protein n=1 Tax=unclassified Butyrivibrio TaxID=2639466 RepID=UPI0005D17386|nr:MULTISPECIES: SH3 domain-containing protein [unclassified Butyrivibrio]